jgi:hypothetical protein
MLICADMRGALKEHVLKEMSKPGATRAFIGRPNVIPEIYGDDGRSVVLREGDTQPV